MGEAPKKRRWGRRAVMVLVAIIVPLAVGYWVATSEPFFKNVILPKAGQSLNAKITVADASVKPFSEVVLRGVKIQTTGSEPLATVQEARVRHSLMDILRGNLKVHEIAAVAPSIRIVTNPDGTSNLDPILRSQQRGPKSGQPSERKPRDRTKLDIGRITIENATLRKTQLVEGAAPKVSELSNFNLTVDNVQNGESGSIDLSGRLQGELAGALQGKIKFALTQNLKPATLSGIAGLSDFSITRSNRITPTVNLELNFDSSLDPARDSAVLQKFQLTATQNQKPLVTASLAQPMSIALGQATASLPDSTLNAKITGFSFKDWAALLGEDVPEGNLNADMEVQSRESGKLLALKGNAELTGLMLNDPEKRKLMKPLEAKLRIDSSFRDKVLELAQLAVALTPTQLAKNDATVTGRIDLSRPKAITGRLELASDALDLNGYYDLLKGDESGKAKRPRRAAPAAAPPPSQPAPQKKALPFKDLVVNTRIGDVYLRELRLTNVTTSAKLDRTRIDLKPISLALNGAPVNGTLGLDVAVPGYGYELALKLDQVPLAPIANSFAREYRGRAKGDLHANLQIKGVGTTGTTLQKTLEGQIIASCTNGQIELAGKKMRRLLDNVATYLRLPELRTAALTAFGTEIGLGQGKIQIKRLDLVSDAFTAHTEGAIALADVLTNSPIPRLPVTFALGRSLAERANLIRANFPTNTPYVPLPEFLYLTGTLGKPDTDQNEAVIAGIVARGVLPYIGGDAGKVLDALLGGGQRTNAPSTNQPTNPLDRLFKRSPK